MRSISVKLILVLFVVCGTSCSTKEQPHEQQVAQTSVNPVFQSNPTWRWILSKPENTEACALWFTFEDQGRLTFSYRGLEFTGTYRFDEELPNYVYINIPERLNWNNDCEITPWYLSLYNDDTDFSYTMTDEFLYFKKMDKVLTFRKEIVS